MTKNSSVSSVCQCSPSTVVLIKEDELTVNPFQYALDVICVGENVSDINAPECTNV